MTVLQPDLCGNLNAKIFRCPIYRIYIIPVGEPVDKINPQEFKDIFNAIASLYIGDITQSF